MRILSAKSFQVKLKATIHKSGRLGFTEATQHAIGINQDTCLRFATDDIDGETILFMSVSRDFDEDAFKVYRSGSYYSIPTTQLFNSLGLDYRSNIIMFDLVREPKYDAELQGECYRMLKRSKHRLKQ